MHPFRFFGAGARRASALRPPSLCAVCHGWGERRVCEPCLGRFAAAVPRCRRCALRVPDDTRVCGGCLVDPPPFDRTWAAVDYDHPWDALISAFKFHDALDLAPLLAGLMLTARERADDPEPLPTLVLPVPLSAGRLRERGYNQAWELARRVARSLRARADPGLLLRVRDTAHQLTFPPAERAGNVRHAFAVEPRRLGEVRGARVALVDDVMTSGATAAELARVLRQAGAATVGVWVVARTPAPAQR